jgi:hypothetical protein
MTAATYYGEIDAYTLKHLGEWLEHQIDGDTCREAVRAAMLELVATDPEYYGSQSWWNVFDRIDGQSIREKYR